jgi:arylsulfatase
VYPRREYRFPNVKIGLTYKESVPDIPRPIAAPPGAPNVLLVLLDDIGFGWPSAFGGLVRMPTAEQLAAEGLRYSQFHTTGLCPPTRAALLTGRNHHSAHSGRTSELTSGFPGYDGVIPRSCATIAELLRANGYATGCWGKNHNVPDAHTSEAGPFDNWPTQRGFDYFYGFLGEATDQFTPALYRGTYPIAVPGAPEDGYHLTRDLADDCIGWMRRQKSIVPDRPLFVYFAAGAAHAPHQPPLDWRGRNRNRFDMGWDAYRRQTWQRQLDMGVIPRGTRLTPRPAPIAPWAQHSDDEQQVLTRQAENYADFLEHADHEVGRVVAALDGMGELGNTLVVYVIGDSGSSAEGGIHGTPNAMLCLNGFTPTFEQLARRLDDLGLPGSSPHYAVGWAWAGDTPFQWAKQVASHFGATRNGVIVSWPRHITDVGKVRPQFHHVIDVLPTILEAIGIAEPDVVNGVPQKPIEGVSFAYTFGADGARVRSARQTQYFEIFGNRALYHNGWVACCRQGRLPFDGSAGAEPSGDRWELYHIAEDFSESVDLAGKDPARLRHLQDLFIVEAAKYNVLPLDDRTGERAATPVWPSYFAGRERITLYPGMIRLPERSAPRTHNVSHTITVEAYVPAGGAEGVLICLGGQAGGWSLYIKDGRLVYHYNWFDLDRYEVVSEAPVPEGAVQLSMEFVNDGAAPGGPATVRLAINGHAAGEGRIPRQVRARFGTDTLDVGLDALCPVSSAYADRRPFPFTGAIDRVVLSYATTKDQDGPDQRPGFKRASRWDHASVQEP